MQEKDLVITRDGHQKLLDELDLLTHDKRREVAERIKVAREFGDLRENSEYESAKNEQAFVEGRIAQIRHILNNARIAEAGAGGAGEVMVGCFVKLSNLEDNNFEIYHIVGSSEADPFAGKISNESPIGEAIMGKKEGDVVDAHTPIGIRQYEVIKVSDEEITE